MLPVYAYIIGQTLFGQLCKSKAVISKARRTKFEILIRNRIISDTSLDKVSSVLGKIEIAFYWTLKYTLVKS